jgi:hypothetical protein
VLIITTEINIKFYKIKNYYEKKILGLLAITLLFGLVGCEDVEYAKPGTFNRKAVVVTLIHSPSEHNTELTRQLTTTTLMVLVVLVAPIIAVIVELKLVKKLQVTTTTIPERFGWRFNAAMEHSPLRVRNKTSSFI